MLSAHDSGDLPVAGDRMEREMKKHRWIAVMLLVLFLLAGCGAAEEEEKVNEFTLYYLDHGSMTVLNSKYQAESTTSEALLIELRAQMKQLFQKVESNQDIVSYVEEEGLSIEHQILNVTFGEAYNSLDEVDELLFRASYVLTMTQIPGISMVRFFVGEDDLRDANGIRIGGMNEFSFTSNIGEGTMTYTTETVTYYFATEAGDKLVSYTEDIRLNNNMSKEQYIVNQLVYGPEQEGFYPVMDKTVQVLNVSTKENICYVNFDETFLTGYLGVDSAVTLYAVVNSLTELPHVNYVQISISGDTTYEFAGVRLSELLQRNLDYVSTEK